MVASRLEKVYPRKGEHVGCFVVWGEAGPVGDTQG